MSTTTLGLAARVQGAFDTVASGTKSAFGKMLERAIAARETEARRRAAAYLNFLSDDRLAEMGMSAQDIQLMRESGRVPPTIWS